MRIILVLLVVAGFVAFATSLPVNKDDSKSKETEDMDVDSADGPEESSEDVRRKRMADPDSSSSEESDENKKTLIKVTKDGAETAAAEGTKAPEDGTAAAGNAVESAKAALRRKRCINQAKLVDVSSEETKEENNASEEKSNPTSDSDENKEEPNDENVKETEEDQNEA